jgi:molybdopterin/thiamine biosynthesis adenylyltransferase/rhodanese-related sulfurtransferase
MTQSVNQTFQNCDRNKQHIILDVRTADEWSLGIPKGAHCLTLNDIADKAEEELSKDNHYYVMCRTHVRSSMAIEELKKLGFTNLHHVAEGYQGWHENNLPSEIPDLDKFDISDLRYQRHHQLKGFGRSAQQKLSNAHVLLIGAGGLGSSSALYLAAAGVGQLTIIDDDKVSLSNLQRQIIHRTDGIGQLKVESAKQQLSALNPEISINTIAKRLDPDNVQQLIQEADIVVDGSDNLATRYLVNDYCLKLKKPLVYAAVYQYEAQISVFDFTQANAPCLRCLFPQTEGFEPANCSTEGVLGVVPGMAGVMQATEVIKLITGIGDTLNAQLLVVDLFDNSFRKIKFTRDKNCQIH